MYVVDEDEHCVWRTARTGRGPSPATMRRASLTNQQQQQPGIPNRRQSWTNSQPPYGMTSVGL